MAHSQRMKILGVIPARYHSTRLEGKALLDICGKPMIQRVYERAKLAPSLSRVLVATDDERILRAVEAFGGEAIMTKADHTSGTDRVAEVARSRAADIVVNIQGDEPLLAPEIIEACVKPLILDLSLEMSTARLRIADHSDIEDPNVVKVVCDPTGRALYFSRYPIPYPRRKTEEYAVFEHVGIYAYTRTCLLRFAKLKPTPLETIEGLEQLRALENGIAIHAAEVTVEGETVSVDTPEDLKRVRRLVAARESGAPASSRR